MQPLFVSCFFVILLIVLQPSSAANVKDKIDGIAYQWAPFTPFMDDSSIKPTINFSAIYPLVESSYNMGVNMYYIGGSFAQFTALSIDERKQLCSTFINATKSIDNDNIYTIFHVSSTRIDESVELARYANDECGVDAIGSLPPYYNRVSTTDNFDELFKWFKPIIEASHNLSFWYYHSPNKANYHIEITDLLKEAVTNNGLPQLKGIKFFSNNLPDYYNSMDLYGTINISIIPWFQPNLAIIPINNNDNIYNQGYGLMDYNIPAYKCMNNAFRDGRNDDAYFYQSWINNMTNIILRDSTFTGMRCLYQRLYNIDLGSPRPPILPYTQQQCQDIILDLDDAGFFNQIEIMRNDTNCI